MRTLVVGSRQPCACVHVLSIHTPTVGPLGDHYLPSRGLFIRLICTSLSDQMFYVSCSRRQGAFCQLRAVGFRPAAAIQPLRVGILPTGRWPVGSYCVHSVSGLLSIQFVADLTAIRLTAECSARLEERFSNQPVLVRPFVSLRPGRVTCPGECILQNVSEDGLILLGTCIPFCFLADSGGLPPEVGRAESPVGKPQWAPENPAVSARFSTQNGKQQPASGKVLGTRPSVPAQYFS